MFQIKRLKCMAQSAKTRTIWNTIKDYFYNPAVSTSNEPFVILSPVKSSVKKWISFSDKPFGGTSSSIVTLKDYDDDSSAEISSTVTKRIVEFSGDIVFNEEIAKQNKTKASFSSCKGEFYSTKDLRNYQGIELTVKSSVDLVFNFNLTCSSLFEGDLYQITLEMPGGSWHTFHIPFRIFMLVGHGAEREVQRENDSLRLQSVGFLVTDDKPKSFRLEIKEIKVIPEIDNELLKRTLKRRN